MEILGFGKCYHMSDVYQRGQAERWLLKAEGKDTPWESLLNDCKSAVDWPVAAYYEELAERYPDAKFILTVRNPDSWYRSITNTIYPLSTLVPWWMQILSRGLRARVLLLDKLIWKGIFDGRLEEPEYAKRIFTTHNETVPQRIGADRVLVYEISQGWEPLSEFLGVPVPVDTPFPHVNLSSHRISDLRKLKLQRLLPMALIAIILVTALIWWL